VGQHRNKADGQQQREPAELGNDCGFDMTGGGFHGLFLGFGNVKLSASAEDAVWRKIENHIQTASDRWLL
jgi:hypothetical protein